VPGAIDPISAQKPRSSEASILEAPGDEAPKELNADRRKLGVPADAGPLAEEGPDAHRRTGLAGAGAEKVKTTLEWGSRCPDPSVRSGLSSLEARDPR
jgi:hypothetical protein